VKLSVCVLVFVNRGERCNSIRLVFPSRESFHQQLAGKVCLYSVYGCLLSQRLITAGVV